MLASLAVTLFSAGGEPYASCHPLPHQIIHTSHTHKSTHKAQGLHGLPVLGTQSVICPLTADPHRRKKKKSKQALKNKLTTAILSCVYTGRSRRCEINVLEHTFSPWCSHWTGRKIFIYFLFFSYCLQAQSTAYS